jgi:hypothetical protein
MSVGSIIDQLDDFNSEDVSIFQKISEVESCTTVIGYAHLYLAVSDMENSIAFYSICGFELDQSAGSDPVVVMRNRLGIELHLVLCDIPIPDGKNILMDFPEEKFPGHTHAAFQVSNVPACREYLESCGISMR